MVIEDGGYAGQNRGFLSFFRRKKGASDLKKLRCFAREILNAVRDEEELTPGKVLVAADKAGLILRVSQNQYQHTDDQTLNYNRALGFGWYVFTKVLGKKG